MHAGEAYGPESIHQAVHYCGAHRVGHGTRLKEDGDLTEKIKITFLDNSIVYLEPTSLNNNILHKIKIPPNEITKLKDKTYAYDIYQKQDFGYLQFNKCHDKIDILDGIESYVKP